MRKWTLVCVGLLLLSNLIMFGTELPAQDAKVIAEAGIPIYSGVTFATGSRDVGYRFATSKPSAEVRQWYREKLSGGNADSRNG